MCGAQLSGRQVLGRARLGGGQVGRALPSCTTNMWAPCRHTRLRQSETTTRRSDDDDDNETIFKVKKAEHSSRSSASKWTCSCGQSLLHMACCPHPTDSSAPGRPRSPIVLPAICFPFKHLVWTPCFSAPHFQGDPTATALQKHQAPQCSKQAFQSSSLIQLAPYKTRPHSGSGLALTRLFPSSLSPSAVVATYKFEHVPIKHIVIGETLAMEQVPEELSQV